MLKPEPNGSAVRSLNSRDSYSNPELELSSTTLIGRLSLPCITITVCLSYSQVDNALMTDTVMWDAVLSDMEMSSPTLSLNSNVNGNGA